MYYVSYLLIKAAYKFGNNSWHDNWYNMINDYIIRRENYIILTFDYNNWWQ